MRDRDTSRFIFSLEMYLSRGISYKENVLMSLIGREAYQIRGRSEHGLVELDYF